MFVEAVSWGDWCFWQGASKWVGLYLYKEWNLGAPFCVLLCLSDQINSSGSDAGSLEDVLWLHFCYFAEIYIYVYQIMWKIIRKLIYIHLRLKDIVTVSKCKNLNSQWPF